MEKEIRIFKPNVTEEKPIGVGIEELAYAPRLLAASKDGFIPVDLEKDVIIQRVSHDLYASPKSGFRELYENEARACRAAKENGSNPRIEITVSPSNRKLVIHGIDSMGISQQVFIELYRYLGRSDNWSGREVGQYGLGKASYVTLSDTMLLETYSREDGTRYAVVGKSAKGYSLAPEPKDLDEYGTRLTMILRDDVDIGSLHEYIVECTRFSGIETYLNLEDDLTDEFGGSKIRDAGRYRLGPESFDEYLEKQVKKESYYVEKLVRYIPIKVEDEDFSLYGAYIIKHGYSGDSAVESGRLASDVFLLGVPVEARSIRLPFSGWVLNLLDERKYQPTADRERLQEESESALMEKVEPKLREALSFLNIESINEYLNSDYKELYHGFDELGLEYYLSDRTVDICRFLTTPVKELGNRRHGKLYELLRESSPDNLFYLSRSDYRRASVIQANVPGAAVFVLKHPGLESIERLRRYGVNAGEEFIREKKLRGDRNPGGDIAVHSAGTGYYSWERFKTVRKHVDRVTVGQLDEQTVRVPKGRSRPYLALLSALQTSYKIALDNKELSGGILLSDFVNAVGSKEVKTNRGMMSPREMLKSNDKVRLHLYSDPALSEFYAGKEGIEVFGESDLLFELAVFLTYNGAKYEIDESEKIEFEAEFPDVSYRPFLNDPDYAKIGDSEILHSVMHVLKAVKDEGLRAMFLNAVRYSRDAEEVRSMRETALRLDN